MKKALCAAVFFVALAIGAAADATVYTAIRAVGGGNLNLSITTDGALGSLLPSNILDWNITMTEGLDAFTLQGPGGSNNSTVLLSGTGLSATASQLSFNFGGSALPPLDFCNVIYSP